MAADAISRPAPRRREEEVLVWPDLLFVEFIAALIFTIGILVLSFAANAPLLDEANPDRTPNPSKAPWYFLNLQELLVHMHPALAGVVVPTVWLILLAIMPYWDRSNEGQGVWFGTPGAVKLTVVWMFLGALLTLLLILWDAGKLEFLPAEIRTNRAIQTEINWPEWTTDIPYLPFEIRILNDRFQHLDFPAFLVEQAIPLFWMVGVPIGLLVAFWKAGWIHTRRDAMVALFSGFVGAMAVLTLIGTSFRGQGLELLWPWDIVYTE
jgi:hypothetical protein